MHHVAFRDPADRPEACVRPDIAAELDTMEDRVLEIIARQAVQLPAGIRRTAFNLMVSKVAIAALTDAKSEGVLCELFDEVEPTRLDMELVARVLARLIDADNPRLEAKCLDFVLGTGLCHGISETKIAGEEGVGKAAVSKRCKVLQEDLGLPPSRGMKSDAACANYAKRQTGKRAKPKPQPWLFAGMLRRAYGL